MTSAEANYESAARVAVRPIHGPLEDRLLGGPLSFAPSVRPMLVPAQCSTGNVISQGGREDWLLYRSVDKIVISAPHPGNRAEHS